MADQAIAFPAPQAGRTDEERPGPLVSPLPFTSTRALRPPNGVLTPVAGLTPKHQIGVEGEGGDAQHKDGHDVNERADERDALNR